MEFFITFNPKEKIRKLAKNHSGNEKIETEFSILYSKIEKKKVEIWKTSAGH